MRNWRNFFCILIFPLSSVLFSEVILADIGFISGNDMTSISVAGDVSLICSNGSNDPAQTVAFQCRDTILVPQEFDYFTGPINLGADQVEVTVTRADGSVRTKQSSYDSRRGLSESKFNLWINSILQRPLLGLGDNRASYKLTRNGQLVKQGQFLARVKIGGFSQCKPGQYYSNNPTDCSQPYTYCQRFFQEKNYCQ